MECDKCKYLIDNANTVSQFNMVKCLRVRACKIKSIVCPEGCHDIESDDDIENMNICYNCKYWMGGGDFGLSCRKDYYNCSANGFDKACEKFEKINV